MTDTTTKPKDSATSGILRYFSNNMRQYGLLAALIAIIALFAILTGGRLLLPGNVNNLITQNAYVIVLAIGMVMVIIARHIDLSVGSVVALVGAVTAIGISQWHLPWPLAVLLGIVVGGLIGVWQGFWIAYVGIPAFIVTLAGMLLFRGLTLVVLNSQTIGGLPQEFNNLAGGWVPSLFGTFDVSGIFGRQFDEVDLLTIVVVIIVAAAFAFGEWRKRRELTRLELPKEPGFAYIGKIVFAAVFLLFLGVLLAAYNGVPIVLIILAVLIIGYSFVLNRTVFGRNIYAMGGNLQAAALSGVRTKRVDFLIFVNMGALAGLAGVLVAARAGAANPTAGTSYELDAIAAVFIGGAAVTGGVGTVIGAVIGAFVMGVLNMGLSILSVDQAWQQAIKGLVLLLAVAFDLFNKRRSSKG